MALVDYIGHDDDDALRERAIVADCNVVREALDEIQRLSDGQPEIDYLIGEITRSVFGPYSDGDDILADRRHWYLHLAVPGSHSGPEVAETVTVRGRTFLAFRQASRQEWGEELSALLGDREHLIVDLGVTTFADALGTGKALRDALPVVRFAPWTGTVLTDADDWEIAATEIGHLA
jgi:hypothetical protein